MKGSDTTPDSSLAAASTVAAASGHPADPSPATKVRYWVLAILCAAAAIAYIQRYAINKLNTPIQANLELHESQMGVIMGGFFAAYGMMQIPAGWLADRWGSRRALATYAIAWSLLTGLMGFGGGFAGLLCIWTCMGAAQAGLFPSAMIAIREWLPATRRALASGLLASFMNVGAALSPIIVVTLLLDAAWSWQTIFMALSLPGLAWAVLYYSWFRDRPAEHRRVNPAERQLIVGAVDVHAIKPGRGPVPWRILAVSPAMWLIGGQQFFRAAAQVFFGTWFGKFLEQSPGLSPREAGLLASVPLIVLMVGSVVGGVISDWLLARTGSRRIARQGLSVANLLLCAACFGAAYLAEDSYVRVAWISLGCAAMAIGGVSAYAITMDMGGGHVATVFSIMNASGSVGAAAFPVYVGWLLDATHNWNYVLLSIAVIYLGAAACWALLDPRGTVFDKRSAE